MVKFKVSPSKAALSASLILAVLCIFFYAQKELERTIRMAKETELKITVKAKQIVEKRLDDAKKQIAARDEQIKAALDKLNKEALARKDLEAMLAYSEKEKYELAVQLEEIAAHLTKPVELGKIDVGPGKEVADKGAGVK